LGTRLTRFINSFDCRCTDFLLLESERAENARDHERRKVGACFTLVEAEVVAEYIKKLFLHEVHLCEVEVFGVRCPM